MVVHHFCSATHLCLTTAYLKINSLHKTEIMLTFHLSLGHSSVTWSAEQNTIPRNCLEQKLKEKPKSKTLTVTVSLIYLVFYRSLNGLKSTSFPIAFLTVGKIYSMSKCMWTAWGSATCKDFTDQSIKSQISCSFYNLFFNTMVSKSIPIANLSSHISPEHFAKSSVD